MSSKLIIVCGLPGSGKTTYAKRLEKDLGCIRFCPDDWMDALEINLYDSKKRDQIENLQFKLTQDLLSLNLGVIIEWGTWTKKERDLLRLKAKELGSQVELHYLFASAKTLFERIQSRGKENPPIQKDMVDQWVNVFEVPTLDEIALFDKVITIQS